MVVSCHIYEIFGSSRAGCGLEMYEAVLFGGGEMISKRTLIMTGEVLGSQLVFGWI